MKRILGFILPFFLGTLLVGCSQDAASDSNGKDALVKFSVSENEKVVVIGTRADGEGTIFKIEVLDSDGKVVKSYDDHTEITEGVSLKAGNYTFRASTGSDVEAAFDSPYYMGTKEMKIESGNSYNVDITCHLANAMVSVSTSDLIKENFPEFTVTVSNIQPDNEGNFDDSSSLEFDYETEEDEDSGFFRVTGILAYKVELTNTANVSNTLRGVIKNVQPQRHYKLNFKINENGNGESGLSLIDIVIDDELGEIEWDFVIDIDADGAPSFGDNDDYDLDQPIEFEEGEQINFSLDIDSPNAISSLTVAHTSNHIASLGIPKSFDIMTLSDNDEAAINAAGLTWTVSNVKKTRAIHEDIYSVELKFDGLLASLPGDEYDFTVTVMDQMSKKAEQKLKFVITADEPAPGISLEITPADIDAWARFANISGRWTSDARPEGITLQYRADGQESWSTITTDKLTFSGNGFKAKAMHLAPGTKYYVKAVQGDGEETAEVSFTTEETLQMPNMGFDEWCTESNVLYPSANLTDKYYWDSGNGGSKLANLVPTTQETEFTVSGSAAKLSSLYKWMFVEVFAAGSLYTGSFGSASMSPMGAELNFGREYTGRPSRLKGYYNYSSGVINRTKAPYKDLSGEQDNCHIWVVLADWDAPFEVNTGKSIFVDTDDESIIAFGEMYTNQSSPAGQYLDFEIELEYRDDRKPTYGLIVCSSSKYGDYFTGSDKSVLYVDEFEFVFDPE